MNTIPQTKSPRHFPIAPADGLLAAVLLSFLATAGLFYVNIMPALVSGLIDGLGFSKRDAGLVASANVYGAAFGALIAVFLVRRISWRPSAIAILFSLIAVDLISTFIKSADVLIAVRFLHGTIGGMLVGIGFAVIARTRVPDRTFGMLLVVQFGLGGVGVMFLPRLVSIYGTPVLFLALAAFSVVTLAMVPFLDDYPAHGKAPKPGTEQATTSAVPVRWGLLFLALLSVFLFQAGNMALSAYIIELGRAYGQNTIFISNTLGIAAWIGAVGSLLVVFLGTRFGRLYPLIVAFILTVAGNAAFYFSNSAIVFIAANIGTAITWAFVISYLLGLCAAFDKSGQTATIAGFCSKMGLATGPLIGGMILGAAHYTFLIYVAVGVLVMSGVAAFLPVEALDRDAAIARKRSENGLHA